MTLYECSFSLYTIITQANNFKFTDIDLFKEHNAYEQYIKQALKTVKRDKLLKTLINEDHIALYHQPKKQLAIK